MIDDNVTEVATYKYTDKGTQERVNVTITNHKTCVAYDSTNEDPTKGKQTAYNGPTGRNSLYLGNKFFA